MPASVISTQAENDQDWEAATDWFAGQNMNALGFLADSLDRVGKGERVRFAPEQMYVICRLARLGLTEAYLRFDRKSDDCQE